MHNREAYIAAYHRMMRKVWINPVTGCWIFDGAISSSGYGNVRVKLNGVWRVINAHVLSFIVHTGKKPRKRKEVRHACDIRPCCCPDHVSEGTKSQNMRDMMERYRGRNQFQRTEMPEQEPEPCPF